MRYRVEGLCVSLALLFSTTPAIAAGDVRAKNYVMALSSAEIMGVTALGAALQAFALLGAVWFFRRAEWSALPDQSTRYIAMGQAALTTALIFDVGRRIAATPDVFVDPVIVLLLGVPASIVFVVASILAVLAWEERRSENPRGGADVIARVHTRGLLHAACLSSSVVFYSALTTYAWAPDF